MATFLSGLSDSLSSELQEITKERRRRGRPEEKFKTDIFSAIRDTIQRPTVSETQSISDSLETQAAGGKFGSNPNLNVLTGSQVDPRIARADKGSDFLTALSEANIGGISSEGITFRQPQMDLATQLATILAVNNQNGSLGGQQPQQPVPQTSTPKAIEPNVGIEGLPVANRIAQGSRAVQRFLGGRQQQASITKTYSAQTAALAKGLSDSGNIAVAERGMVLNAAPTDGETWVSRQVKDNSMTEMFDSRETVLNEIIQRPIQQIVTGAGTRGLRAQLDPTAIALKKDAQQQLLQLRSARASWRQLFDQANRDMPAIGQPAQGGGGKLKSGVSFTIE